MKLLILALAIIIVGVSCQKFTQGFDGIDSLEQEWLLPTAKSTINFDDIRDITDINFEFMVQPFDLQLPTNSPVDVAPMHDIELGPFLLNLPDIIHLVEFDSLSFQVTLTNPFPFEIGDSTMITYRNENETSNESNVLFRWELSEDLLPYQSITRTQTVGRNYVGETIYAFIENFSTSGGSNLPISDNPMVIQTNFKLINIRNIELNPGQSLTSIDTIGIVIDLPDENEYTETASAGIATLYFDNALPVAQQFQGYFLRDNQVVDSLLVSPVAIAPCANDGQGNPLSIESSTSTATLSWDRLNNLSTCDKLVIHHFISTNPNPNNAIVANESCSLKVQLVVDVKINLSFFKF
jgi:hypothetical protein